MEEQQIGASPCMRPTAAYCKCPLPLPLRLPGSRTFLEDVRSVLAGSRAGRKGYPPIGCPTGTWRMLVGGPPCQVRIVAAGPGCC